MARGWTTWLYAASFGAHALLAAGVSAIHEPAPPPPPIHIVVRDVHRPRAPEPPPAAPEPPPAPAPAPAPSPPPSHPRAPAPAPAPAAPPAPSAPPAPPSFGLALSGATGGGVSVPVGDPSGTPGGTGTGPRTRTAERRTLEAPAAAPAADACTDAPVRPRALAMPRPTYTEEARAAGIEGRVRVEVHIGTGGEVEDVRVVTSLDPGLDEAAIAAVRGAQFTAQTRCGVAEATTFTIGVSFSL